VQSQRVAALIAEGISAARRVLQDLWQNEPQG
jgi:hypothetical protein